MDLIKNYDRKRLLQNLCYVDENLMITQDVSKAVGFLDLITDTNGIARFIINFFTPIGTARHWKDAMVMIKNWLDEKYKDHNLTKYLFEPALPMSFSVALCNENEFIHGKHIEAAWMYLLYGQRYEYAPYGDGLSPDDGGLYFILSTNASFHVREVHYKDEDEIGQIFWDYIDERDDSNVAVYPAVIVDEWRFLYLNSYLDRDDLGKEYSFTYKVLKYNNYKDAEFRDRSLGKPMFQCQIVLGKDALLSPGIEESWMD